MTGSLSDKLHELLAWARKAARDDAYDHEHRAPAQQARQAAKTANDFRILVRSGALRTYHNAY